MPKSTHTNESLLLADYKKTPFSSKPPIKINFKNEPNAQSRASFQVKSKSCSDKMLQPNAQSMISCQVKSKTYSDQMLEQNAKSTTSCQVKCKTCSDQVDEQVSPQSPSCAKKRKFGDQSNVHNQNLNDASSTLNKYGNFDNCTFNHCIFNISNKENNF